MTLSNRPILVTGAHRTGTSWVGKMLSADGSSAYISEPLNVLHRPGVFSVPVSKWYTYITEENGADYLPAFRDLLAFRYHLGAELRALRSHRDVFRMIRDFSIFANGKLRHQRALLKDPFAVFSVAWFAERLNCRVVITVRHPAGFASSLKRLNWQFDFRDLLDQPALMRDWLESERAALQSAKAEDHIVQAALLWRMIYGVVHALCSSQHNFNVVRHEDLSRDPIGGYRDLYTILGLDFNDKVQNVVLGSSSSENPTELSQKEVHSVKLDSRANVGSWKKRLSGDEITRIRKMVEEVSHLYYSDAEWN